MKNRIALIFCLILPFGCVSKIDKFSDSDRTMFLLEQSCTPELYFQNAHFPDAVEAVEYLMHSETGAIKHCSVRLLCKPPVDPGINPFDKDSFYRGPHDGCNHRHVLVPTAFNVSFKEVLDIICQNADATWFVSNTVVYIDNAVEKRGDRVSPNLENDIKQLEKLKVVDGAAVYFSGEEGEFYKLYRAMLKKGVGEKDALAMINSPYPVVRIMGVLCIAQKNRLRYEKKIQSLYEDEEQVKFFPGGCEGSPTKTGIIIKQIMENPRIMD